MRKILSSFTFTGVLILIVGIFVEFPIWVGASILSTLFIVVLCSELIILKYKVKGELVLRTNGREIKSLTYILGFLFLGYSIYLLYMDDFGGDSFFYLLFPMHLLIQTIANIARKKYKPIIYLLDGDTLSYYDLTIKKYDIQKLKELKFHPERKLLQLSFTDATSLVVECTAFDFTELRTFFETLTKKSGLDANNSLNQENTGFPEA